MIVDLEHRNGLMSAVMEEFGSSYTDVRQSHVLRTSRHIHTGFRHCLSSLISH